MQAVKKNGQPNDDQRNGDNPATALLGRTTIGRSRLTTRFHDVNRAAIGGIERIARRRIRRLKRTARRVRRSDNRVPWGGLTLNDQPAVKRRA
jgi:hypothetical protein